MSLKLKKMKNEENFYWWFEERLRYSKVKHGLYNWKKLNTVYSKLKIFRPAIAVSDINYKFLKDFELYLLTLGNCTNTVAENLCRIKVIVNEIVRSGQVEYHKNPFLNFKISHTRTEKKRVPIEDIILLENLDLSLLPNMDVARDMYLFSFYCAGIRFGDLCRLKKSMIKDGYLFYTMHKTKVRRKIKLMPVALRIAFKYEGEFLFNTKVNWDQEDQSINCKNSLFNKWLKRACKACGVTELSYHTSRNSFADHAKKNNIDIHTIKDLLGHTTVKTTEIYMRDFYEEETDQAFNKMFG